MAPLVAIFLATPGISPVAFELQAPDGSEWAGRRKDTAAVAARTLEVRTRLALLSGENLGVVPARLSACRQQPSLGCWVRALLDLRPDPFETRTTDQPPAFLLVRLLPLPRTERALVLMWLVDLEGARRGLQRGQPADLEAWLLRNVTVRRRVELTWGDGALERAFERLWDARGPAYRAAGYWNPNGSIRVQTDWLPPFQWGIDDAPVRTATSAVFAIPRVAAGVRRLALTDGHNAVERAVTVEMGRRSVVHIEGVRPDESSDERSLLLWTGVGTAAAGAALAVAGLTVPVQSELVQVCAPESSCRPPAQFARASDYFSARRTPDDASGPLVVPLGYSLLVTGGVWALTAALSDEPQVPWWAVLLGVVAGGTAYTVSEVVE